MPFLPSLDRMGSNSLGEEVPVTTTPIFEGHLSVRADKKNWQWRLFRFDGSNFTCLSTRKVKLPPNTKQNENIISSAVANTSFYSLTSPLLATPKDKNKRLLQQDGNNKTELKYYQLPEWTIDVVNISSISVLKRAKKGGHLSSSSSRCFSIRTFQGQCFILKAQKQKDLERWLFVLTKMWKFTQAVRDQVIQQQQQHQQQQQQQQYYYPTLNNAQQQQAQAQAIMAVQQQAAAAAVVEDNTPLAHAIQQPTTYDAKYRSPTLSSDKIRVIEEWRKSLAELMANDPTIKVSTPPPIEPIPDDDTMSVFTDMTSVSNRPKSTIKRRTAGGNLVGSKRSATTSRSLRRNKTNSIAPASSQQQQQQHHHHQEMPLESRLVPTLRKRRSDDVRNWMNNNNNSSSLNSNQTSGGGGRLGRTASIGSNRKPMIQKYNHNGPLSISTNPLVNYHQPGGTQKLYCSNANNSSSVSTSPEIIHHMNFFQDVVTVCDDETCNNHHGNNNGSDSNNAQLRYHTSVRGKKLIHINQGEQSASEGNNNNNSNNVTKEERRDFTTTANMVLVPSLSTDPVVASAAAQAATASTPTSAAIVKQEVGVDIKNNSEDFNSSPNQDIAAIVQHRPIKTIIRRASMPLTDDNLLLQQQYQYQQQLLFDQQQINSLQSPLQFLSMKSSNSSNNIKKQQQQQQKKKGQREEDEDEEEEDISLADLQKSLRQIGLHNRSPSASSIQDLKKRPLYYYNNSSIVAPAIPPHQYHFKQPYMFDTTHYHDQQKKFLPTNTNNTAAAASFDSNNKLNHDTHHPNTNSNYVYN